MSQFMPKTRDLKHLMEVEEVAEVKRRRRRRIKKTFEHEDGRPDCNVYLKEQILQKHRPLVAGPGACFICKDDFN